MNYDEFTANVCQGIIELIGKEDMENKSVSLQKVIKNNDVELDALIIIDKGSNASPTIYLNKYYDEYYSGRDFDDIIDEIYGLYCRQNIKIKFDSDIFRDYKKIKNNIVFKLVNAKTNKKLLRDVPHIKILDLAAVLYYMFDDEQLGNATALIHNVHLDMWNVKKADVFRSAKENSMRLLPAEIKSIDDLVKGMIMKDISDEISGSDTVKEKFENEYGSVDKVAEDIMSEINSFSHSLKMYVLTNNKRTNGAACMLYNNVLKDFAEKMQSDFFVLPSSVHEVILVLYEPDISKVTLDNMVKEVNREELEISDILSDHAYFFSRDDGQLHM